MSNIKTRYFTVAVESFYNRDPNKPSDTRLRMRPLPGQGLDTEMLVECDRSMREQFPLGTVFLLSAKITNRLGGTPFLYSYFNRPYAVADRAWVEKHIAAHDIGFIGYRENKAWLNFPQIVTLYLRGKLLEH